MIDLHAHVVLEETLGAAGVWGPFLEEADQRSDGLACYRIGEYELLGVPYRHTAFMDVDLRLRQMDASDITMQVLSPNPLTYFHHIESSAAIEFCKLHNNALAHLVERHPQRLAAFAQLPMQSPTAAVDELHRAVSQLGMLGAYVGTDVGRPLDDPAFDSLYKACTKLNVPLFFHPCPGGIDSPRRDDRLARFDADLWLGFAYEESLAVATLVLGGVLARHGELDVCISHGGGSIGWLAERMAHAAATRSWAKSQVDSVEAVEASLQRVWWDAHVGGPKALRALVESFGTSRLVGGTNFAGWDHTDDPSFGDPELGSTLDTNARRLLRITSTPMR